MIFQLSQPAWQSLCAELVCVLRKGIAAILLCAVGLLSACDQLTTASATFYQKLSVTVNVDGELIVGESVSKVKYKTKKRTFLPEERQSSYYIVGEAVTIDLGEGYYLFALLGHPHNKFDAKRIALKTFLDLRPKRENYKHIENSTDRGWAGTKDFLEKMETHRETRQLEQQPLFVTFDDIADPQTVELVDTENMPASFPYGAFDTLEIVDISLSLVDKQPVTEKIETLLSWIRSRSISLPWPGLPENEVGLEYRLRNGFLIEPVNFKGGK